MFHFLKPFQLLAPGVYSWKIFSVYERNFLTEDKTLYIVEKYRIVHFESTHNFRSCGQAKVRFMYAYFFMFKCVALWA